MAELLLVRIINIERRLNKMSLIWVFLITFVILQVSVIFTSVYLHRYRTHESLSLHPAVALLMHMELLLFTGIVPREWTAVHRKHHKDADREGDPHSPKLLGLWHVFFGNYFYYKRETINPNTITTFTANWKDDFIDGIPYVKWIGRSLGVLIFVFMFGWAWGLGMWLFHVIAYILLNSSINSFCHTHSEQTPDGSYAIDRPILAVFTGGEGNHRGHHEVPKSPNFGRKPGQFDPSWVLILFLHYLGWAYIKPGDLS